MNFFENNYALPVILGNSKEAISIATLLRRDTDLKIHIFAPKLSLIDRMIFNFHKTVSLNDDIMLLTLNDFADSMSDYYTPILIFCGEEGTSFAERNFDLLEQRYVIVSAQTTRNLLSGGALYDENK